MVFMFFIVNFVSQLHHQDTIIATWTFRSHFQIYDSNVYYIWIDKP